MLLEFRVRNFRSIKDWQVFSLAAAKGNELVESNTFTTQGPGDFRLLRSAAIYGPNASGKTNFLSALESMRSIVLESANSKRQGHPLSIPPFRLSKETAQAPSEFEITFLLDKVRYQYGFAATARRIHEEWLIAYPKGRPQRWFERSLNLQSDVPEYRWEMGDKLLGEKQVWQKSTREDTLLLSTAVQLNSRQLQPIYDWFRETLHVIGVGGLNPEFSASLCDKPEKKQVMDFLNAADSCIEDISVEEKPFDPKLLPDDMPEGVRDVVSNEMRDKNTLDIKIIHKTPENDLVAFDFSEESDGTQKLFSFAGPWIDSLARGNVLFIDEMHDNLHPNLVRSLIGLFHSDKTNPRNAQLIFTTHETSILNQEVLRRDQVYFFEKNKEQASELYSLTDFSPRKGRENLELAYLSGRYGALPYIRPLRYSPDGVRYSPPQAQSRESA